MTSTSEAVSPEQLLHLEQQANETFEELSNIRNQKTEVSKRLQESKQRLSELDAAIPRYEMDLKVRI